MELMRFFEKVEGEADLKGIAVGWNDEVSDNVFIVEYVPNGFKTRLPFESVKQCKWEDLRAVIAGEREPNVLYHMARIVGYYSRVENWNKSKIGELHDRHVGNYQVA